TGRVVIVQEAPRVAGFGAELAAVIAEKAILDLRGPVIRVTGFDVPYPFWQLEHATCRRSSAWPRRGRGLSADSACVRVQASRPGRGPDRGRSRPLARPRRPGGGRGRPAGRDPDRQDDGRDPFAGGREGGADPGLRGAGRPGRDGARGDLVG